MQVTSDSGVLITDYEVLQLLRDKEKNIEKGKYSEKDTKKRLKPVEQEVYKYLQTRPAAKQNRAIVGEFATMLKGYDLMQFERFQIINVHPTTEVEFHMLIDHCYSRFGTPTLSEIHRHLDAIQHKHESDSTRAPPPPLSSSAGSNSGGGLSLAVKGQLEPASAATPANASPAPAAVASPPPPPPAAAASPVKEQTSDSMRVDDDAQTKSKSRQMQELISSAASAPRSTRSGSVLK